MPRFPNYNRPMLSSTESPSGACRRSCQSQACTTATREASPIRRIDYVALATTDRRLEYCIELTASNMAPYLARRGQRFDAVRWRNVAPRCRFHLIVCALAADAADTSRVAGFISVRDEPTRPAALHIGDIQLEASLRRRGIGTDALTHAARLARSLGRSELTLHVFRENPAFHLYARQGFEHIATDVINGRYTMCRTLPPPAPA